MTRKQWFGGKERWDFISLVTLWQLFFWKEMPVCFHLSTWFIKPLFLSAVGWNGAPALFQNVIWWLHNVWTQFSCCLFHPVLGQTTTLEGLDFTGTWRTLEAGARGDAGNSGLGFRPRLCDQCAPVQSWQAGVQRSFSRLINREQLLGRTANTFNTLLILIIFNGSFAGVRLMLWRGRVGMGVVIVFISSQVLGQGNDPYSVSFLCVALSYKPCKIVCKIAIWVFHLH